MSEIEVCPLAALPPGEIAVVRAGPGQIAVFNADGELYALEDRCSHQDTYLSDGWLEGCEVECPLHGATFDVRTGQPTGPPATEPVQVYPVHIRNGFICVTTEPARAPEPAE